MTEAVLLVVVGNLRGGAVAGSRGHANFAAESRRAHERKGVVPAARKADSTDVHMLCFTGGRDGRFGRGMVRVGLGTAELLLGRALAVADRAARSRVAYCMVMENIRDWFDLGRKSVVVG